MDTRFSWRLQWEAGATLWVDTSITVKHLHIFAIDDTFSERFADWAVPHPGVDLDICQYLPTAMPHSTVADEAPQPAPHATLPSSFFERYRAEYATMPYSEHQKVYAIIERYYPGQCHYDAKAIVVFLDGLCAAGVVPAVLELGGWKGELAKEMLARFPDIIVWHNIEICQEAVAKSVCADTRYHPKTLPDFFWRYRPLPGPVNTLVLSHVVEHMRAEDFSRVLAHVATLGIQHIYLDIPHITETSEKAWQGWTNTHVLEVGWKRLEEILTAYGYSPVSSDGAQRTYASAQGVATLAEERCHAVCEVVDATV